jgi:uracil-DNA glycosylase family 4
MTKPENCRECILGKPIQTKNGLITLGQSFSAPEGAAKFGVYFVGESLGKHEAQEGLPFRPNGESGSLITHIIENLTCNDPEIGQARKMKRGDFKWDNVVKCRPPNDELAGKSYEKEAIENCRIYNHRSFDSNSGIDSKFNKVILALGGTAFRELTGISGKKRGIEDIRGYVYRSSAYRAFIVGALHPSFIRHGNSRFTASLIYDIKKALLVANGSYRSFDSHPDFIKPRFVVDGKLDALVSLYYKLKENQALTLYYDIENPYTGGEEEGDKGDEEAERTENDTGNRKNVDSISKEITSIQFSYSKDWAINIPWEKPFIKIAIAILSLPNEKVGANVWHHDNPRLEANGAKIGGLNHDLMWAWHHLQPGLWKGLQRIGSFFDVPFDWKYLALTGNEKDENEYGCMDVIAPAYIWPSLILKMKRMGVWESYLKFKLEYRVKVLKPMEQRGLPVDIEEHGKFKEWVEGEVKKEDDELQKSIPEHLRNITPKRKNGTFEGSIEYSYGYIREPPIIRELREAYFITRRKLEARGVQDSDIVSFEKWAERKSGLTFREFNGDGTSIDKLPNVSEKVRRWCFVEPFKASSKQLIRYLKWRIEQDPKGSYYVPKTLKEGRETTGKKELQEVWERTGDEILGSVIRVRSYSKMLNNDIPNWLPDKDGMVRTTFLFDPPSWQLNSRSPNIQNASKHPKEWELIGKTASELVLVGQRFRRIVKAPPGRCVVEFDKSGFHIGVMGFEAHDPLYVKWATQMHTAFTSYIVNEPIGLEGEIDKEKLGWIKKKFKAVRDGQAKPAVLGNQLGLGKRKLYWQNRTFIDELGVRQVGIESERRAKYLQDMLAALFPKVEIYKKWIIEQAHFKSYLKSHYGAIRWFYDAMRWDYKNRSLKNSTEAEAAISHPVQSDAFGHIHSEIIDMAENSEILEEHWLANTIHDSVIFFPEVKKLDRCIEEVLGFMLKPDLVLRDKQVAPNGMILQVEVMASPEGGNWANFNERWNPLGMKEIKI